MAILVTGGAGYIGSHIVRRLLFLGEEVIVLDNLETGYSDAVSDAKLIIGDLRDEKLLSNVFENNKIEGVIHFAANSLVGESMKDPYKYYYNNFYGTLCLVNSMVKHNINKIVFSSTAATYGVPEEIPIKESNKTQPTNVYGETKLAMEKMLHWFSNAHDLNYISLRYFNAAGADESGEIGERHDPETHLIPNILKAAKNNEEINVFGDDYPTIDGTCVRDYIHVTDLSNAHIMAFNFLRGNRENRIYNLGSENGFSVKQVIEEVEKILRIDMKVNIMDRREGDPPTLIASSEKIKEELGWEPKYSDMEAIISTAWNFMKNNQQDYA